MAALLTLLLVLVPSPKADSQKPLEPNELVGPWAIDWGTNWDGGPFRQTTFFYADGRCYSPECRGGAWQACGMFLWFSEGDGASQYVMIADFGTGDGYVMRLSECGELRFCVWITIRRGEYIKIAPREIK